MNAAGTKLGITVLGSGSRGNAVVVQTADACVLIDAGFSARELRRRLEQAGIDAARLRAIIVTHEHHDHVNGLRACARQFDVPIYANRPTAETLRDRVNGLGRLHLFASGTPFAVDGVEFEAFSIPHDANDPVGLVMRCGGRKIGLATDLGHASHLVRYQLRECDLLVLESNHDVGMLNLSPRPWSLKQRILGRHGHLSNAASMELLGAVVHARTRHVILAHASQECNAYELVEKEARACLLRVGRRDIAPIVARQDEVTPTLWV